MLLLVGVAPHAHQLKNFITPQKQKKCTFSPKDANFLVLEYLFFWGLMGMGDNDDSFFFGPLVKNFEMYDKTMTLR